jgi:hypothetical protein
VETWLVNLTEARLHELTPKEVRPEDISGVQSKDETDVH